MITIIYSTHKDEEYNDKFNDHLVLTSGLQWVEVLPYVNHNEYSLSELYNKGIKESKYDIVVCCHNDIKLEKNWGKKLLEDFSNKLFFCFTKIVINLGDINWSIFVEGGIINFFFISVNTFTIMVMNKHMT